MFGGISGVTATRGSGDPQIGARVIYNSREFVYVHNAGDRDIPPSYGITPQTACSSYSGTLSSAAYGQMFGVVVHATLTTGTYGWVCNRGVVQVRIGSAAVDGNFISVGANGVFATYVCGTTGKEVGFIVSASSGSTAMATAYVNL